MVIFGLSYVANMMINMQKKHEEQIVELQRQNSVQRDSNGDLENKNNMLIKPSNKKVEAYGVFEDEIAISHGDFETISGKGTPQ